MDSGIQHPERRKVPRRPVHAGAEFFVDADIIEAETVDLSERGVRFKLEEPLTIFLRMRHEGQTIDRRARITWAQQDEQGRMDYGFEFVPAEEGLI